MKIGIIGFGSLGSALASGLVKSGCVSMGNLHVCDSSPEARALAGRAPYHANVSHDADSAINNCEIIFLTVKGYVFEEISRRIDSRIFSGKTVVSFMAGVSLETLFSLIGNVSLVRAMPSLAIATCEGVIGYTKASADVSGILHKLGYAFEVEPDEIEKVMAFSSCGLGFAAYLIDAFAAAGTSMGFSSDTSAQIAALTFKTAVDRGSFRDTVNAVATKGGATEQGIIHFDESGVYDIVARAVRKAYERMT